MTNLVSIDLVAGTAYAYVGRERVSGGALDRWQGRDYPFERGRIELFRSMPQAYRFDPRTNAFEEGRAAFRRGALRTGNPFQPCDPDHQRWDQGWVMESEIVERQRVD